MSFNFKTIARAAMTIAAAMTLFYGSARAAVDPINKSFTGTALQGYDPVAYFRESKPVRGKSEFRRDWMGAKWYFASAENRDAFAKEPQKYAPQFGGYCAWAVAHGYTANIDPNAWKIVDGKLYLNYSKDVRKKWEADIPGFIKQANENWPKLKK